MTPTTYTIAIDNEVFFVVVIDHEINKIRWVSNGHLIGVFFFSDITTQIPLRYLTQIYQTLSLHL